MKKIALFVILCLLISIVFSCKNNEEGNTYLTSIQALSDYEFMWGVLEANYPLFGALEQLPHNRIYSHNIKSHYLKELKREMRSGKIRKDRFFEILDNTLSIYNQYGHLSIVSSDLYGLMHNIYVVNRNSLPDKYIYDYLKDTVDLDRSKCAYSFSDNDNTQMDIETPDLEKEICETIKLTIEDGIAIVSVSTFAWPDSQCIPLAVAKLQEYCKLSADTTDLIIDIRNNNGGSSVVWTEGLVATLINAPLTYNQLYGYMDGDMNAMIFGESIPSENYVSKTQILCENNISIDELGLSYLDRFFVDPITVYPNQSGYEYSGHIWVLVNGTVYSAADAFAAFCKNTGFATVVGMKTHGSGLGTEPMIFSLPNSGFLVRYDALFGFNSDGTSNAITGTAPDIMIDNQDALEYVLNLIHSRAN